MTPTSQHRTAYPRPPHPAAFTGAFALVFMTLLAPAAMAQTFYVDNQSLTCSNVGLGTEAEPYCSISAALAAQKGPGITILVKPGVYREQVTIPASGAEGLPYVIRALGAGVVVDGSDDLAGAGLWAPAAGSTWLAASVSWTPKQVYVDGARLAASTAAPDLMPPNTFRWVSGEGLYVNLGGDNPGAHATLVGRRNYGFNMFTKSWVTIDGFEVAHTEDRGINIQNGCTDLVISNNRVSFANSYGIQTVNGQRIVIEGNVVSACNLHGIGLTAGASGCIVRNNESFGNAHPTIRQANGIYLFGAPANTLYGNNVHHNQDTGMQFGTGANNCVSSNNRSWQNGDHGYDHLGASGTSHVNDIAFNNFLDGFSVEGASPGTQLFNCIGTENGEFNLWVDAASSVGFVSDHNIFWNSSLQDPIKFVATRYASLAAYQLASGQDTHSIQADPLFANGLAGDFTLSLGSPGIDAAHSGVPNWPATDAAGGTRLDDPRKGNQGEGPVSYSDIGTFEYVPIDGPPVVSSPSVVRVAAGGTISFTVTVSDPDGDPITSLVMVPAQLPANSGAVFTPNSTNTGGTFTWATGAFTGNYRVKFVASNWRADTARTNLQIKANGRAAMSESEGAAALSLQLSNGFPNPSSAAMEFALDLPQDSDVNWGVFDTQGRRVWGESRALAAGRTTLRWAGITSGGTRVGTGVYFVRVQIGDRELTRRVIRF